MTATAIDTTLHSCGGRFQHLTSNRFRRIERCSKCWEQRTQWTLKLWRPKVGETPIDNARVAKAEAKRARKAGLRRLSAGRADGGGPK